MVPVVALVGRPNVGKSTLFNRLTRTRDALVADFPGLTRDRKYGRAEVEGREFICIDTGGIDGTEDGVETRMAEQSLLAIEEADVALPLLYSVTSGASSELRTWEAFWRICSKAFFSNSTLTPVSHIFMLYAKNVRHTHISHQTHRCKNGSNSPFLKSPCAFDGA